MIENFPNFTSIEAEMGVHKVDTTNNSDKNKEPWIVTLPLSLERIVTKFISVWQVMDVGFFFKIVTVCIRRKDLLMTKNNCLILSSNLLIKG